MDLFPTAKPNLSGVKNYEPGKPIEELERELGIRGAIKMASNENALGPSPRALAAIKKALSRLHRYPDGGSFFLKEKLAKRLKVSADQLIFGNGSDEILVLAVRAFVGAGDEVVIADPTFLIYEIATQAEAGSVVKVPMKNFRYDLPAMAARINERTKLVFIANPDNPVGTYVTRTEVESFMKRVPGSVVVVLDEAYQEFAEEKKDYPDGLALLKRYPNLIVTRTFSKIYGLSGLRIGYGVGSVSMIKTLGKLREPFNVNLLAQVAAEAALDDRVHLNSTLAMVRQGKKYLSAELKKLGLDCLDSATNFLLVNVKQDGKLLYGQLLKKGIIVRPMNAWGLSSYLRVTIGKPEENKKFIKVLSGLLNK